MSNLDYIQKNLTFGEIFYLEIKSKNYIINYMKFKKGFTLIELLVVIAIIGTLSTIVLASLNSARSKSRDAARISSMQETRNALQMYFNDKGEFPYLDGTGAGTVGAQQWKDRPGYGLIDQGYIKDVNPDIRYYALHSTLANTCASPAQECVKAWLYVKLENRNNVLNSDADRSYDSTAVYVPDGLSTLDNCEPESGITNATDLCYDIEV